MIFSVNEVASSLLILLRFQHPRKVFPLFPSEKDGLQEKVKVWMYYTVPQLHHSRSSPCFTIHIFVNCNFLFLSCWCPDVVSCNYCQDIYQVNASNNAQLSIHILQPQSKKLCFRNIYHKYENKWIHSNAQNRNGKQITSNIQFD